MDIKRLDHAELHNLLTMGLWQTRRQAFDFFKKRLRKICKDEYAKRHPAFDDRQLDYVAGILTEFSFGSIPVENWPLPPPKSKELKFLEKLYNIPNLPIPTWRCERMGRVVLFIGGFEMEYIKKYYSRYWVILIGERLFLEAAVGYKTDLLLGISRNFGMWLDYLQTLKYEFIYSGQSYKPPIIIP